VPEIIVGFPSSQIAFAIGWLCVAATTPPLPTDTIEHEGGV
jgi:hypothetical protein